MNEWELLAQIKRSIPRSLQGTLGLGDDADGLSVTRGTPILVSTDAMVENIDFERQGVRPQWVGHKALAINMSDMAAMGARPEGFVITLGLPKGVSSQWVHAFYEGMLGLAKRYRIKFLGGDLTRAKELFANVTILGTSWHRRAITRAGSKSGDQIGVTGALGGSLLGHHLKFEPRILESRFLSYPNRAHAMIDISDGLVQDLEHMARASKKEFMIELTRIPVSKSAYKKAHRNGEKALEYALSDGEDFELAFTASDEAVEQINRLWPKRFPDVRLTWIGRVKSGAGEVSFLRQGNPVQFELKKKGYSHF